MAQGHRRARARELGMGGKPRISRMGTDLEKSAESTEEEREINHKRHIRLHRRFTA